MFVIVCLRLVCHTPDCFHLCFPAQVFKYSLSLLSESVQCFCLCSCSSAMPSCSCSLSQFCFIIIYRNTVKKKLVWENLYLRHLALTAWVCLKVCLKLEFFMFNCVGRDKWPQNQASTKKDQQQVVKLHPLLRSNYWTKTWRCTFEAQPQILISFNPFFRTLDDKSLRSDRQFEPIQGSLRSGRQSSSLMCFGT